MRQRQHIAIGDECAGLSVRYIKRSRLLVLAGHYDHYTGIAGDALELGDFLMSLGITLQDCEQALKREQAKRAEQQGINPQQLKEDEA